MNKNKEVITVYLPNNEKILHSNRVGCSFYLTRGNVGVSWDFRENPEEIKHALIQKNILYSAIHDEKLNKNIPTNIQIYLYFDDTQKKWIISSYYYNASYFLLICKIIYDSDQATENDMDKIILNESDLWHYIHIPINSPKKISGGSGSCMPPVSHISTSELEEKSGLILARGYPTIVSNRLIEVKIET